MKPNVAAALCAALVGLLAWSQSAIAEPKTARQCNSDWTANKASIQASGKTKCRGVPIAARPSAAPDKSQYATEPEAKANCPSDAVVWVNPASHVYHGSGSRNYGKPRTGASMCWQDSVAAGFRAAKIARRPDAS